MDFENNDFDHVELGGEPFIPELDRSISQQVENPPLVVSTKCLLRPYIKSVFFIGIFLFPILDSGRKDSNQFR